MRGELRSVAATVVVVSNESVSFEVSVAFGYWLVDVSRISLDKVVVVVDASSSNVVNSRILPRTVDNTEASVVASRSNSVVDLT